MQTTNPDVGNSMNTEQLIKSVAPEYQSGWRCFEQGVALKRNPYPTDTAQHNAWSLGWRSCMDWMTGEKQS